MSGHIDISSLTNLNGIDTNRVVNEIMRVINDALFASDLSNEQLGKSNSPLIDSKNEFDGELNKIVWKLQRIVDLQKAAESSLEKMFVSAKDLSKMTGWSVNTCREIFNREDFPCCDYGQEKRLS